MGEGRGERSMRGIIRNKSGLHDGDQPCYGGKQNYFLIVCDWCTTVHCNEIQILHVLLSVWPWCCRVLLVQGHYSKVSPTGWLQMQMFLVSGSWRTEFGGRGSGLALLPAEGLDEESLLFSYDSGLFWLLVT